MNIFGDRAISALPQSVSDFASVPNPPGLSLFAGRQTGTEGPDTLTGGEGRDRLDGLGGDDVLIGNAGDDRLDGGAGDDRMLGGTGDDTYIVDGLGDRVEEDAGAGTDTVQTTTTTYTLGANVENLRFMGTSTSVGVGNGLANTMVGTNSGDTLQSLGGNDRLVGGGGNDVLIGGSGRDVLEGGDGADRFQFFRGESTVAEPDRIRDFDVDGGDVIDLSGLGGLEFIGTDAFGGEAGELRFEQRGRSTLVSGDLDGDRRADFAIRLDGAKVLTEDDFRLSGFTRTGTEGADTLTGASGDDTLLGLGGDDLLIGNAGNDTLDGGTGRDRLQGGVGDDTYIVDTLSDRVEEGADAGADTVRTTTTTYTLGANVENLQFLGTSTAVGVGNGLANTMSGTAAGDTLQSLGGDDRLIGGGGGDLLIGGSGRDTYEGGEGADRFQFFRGESTPETPDVISDFEQDGGDVIDLSGLGSLDFIGTAEFGGRGAAELRYEQQGGSTLVSADLDGNGAADFAISLGGDQTLTEDDFQLANSSSAFAYAALNSGDVLM